MRDYKIDFTTVSEASSIYTYRDELTVLVN